jgi:hypothetical protein
MKATKTEKKAELARQAEEKEAEGSQNDLMFLVKEFKFYYDLEKSHKNAYEKAREKKEAFEERLFAEMTAQEIENVRTKFGLFYKRVDIYASPNPEVKTKLLNWLTRHGFKYLVQKSVNAKSLTTMVREHLGERRKFDPDDKLGKLVNLTVKDRIGVRGGKDNDIDGK